MIGHPLQDVRIGFYRGWSSRAAEQALATTESPIRIRCTHSAGIWTLIADAIEAGQDQEVAHLTHNLLFLNARCLVAAG